MRHAGVQLQILVSALQLLTPCHERELRLASGLCQLDQGTVHRQAGVDHNDARHGATRLNSTIQTHGLSSQLPVPLMPFHSAENASAAGSPTAAA